MALRGIIISKAT